MKQTPYDPYESDGQDGAAEAAPRQPLSPPTPLPVCAATPAALAQTDTMGTLYESPADPDDRQMPSHTQAYPWQPDNRTASQPWGAQALDQDADGEPQVSPAPQPAQASLPDELPATFSDGDPMPMAFPSAKTRAAKLAALAMQGNAVRASDYALSADAAQANAPQAPAAQEHPAIPAPSKESPREPRARRIRADDFATVFGKPGEEDTASFQEIARAFVEAWQEDGDVLRYDGAQPVEADAPPDKTSRAASGWQPMAQEKAVQAAFPAPPHTLGGDLSANELFEAYGASYAEAYAVAVAMEFSEEKPVPDDDVGDVVGPVDSILHTPSGEPIHLGTMAQEDTSQPDVAVPAAPEIALTKGRKAVRYGLLALGTLVIAIAGLYFAGYLL